MICVRRVNPVRSRALRGCHDFYYEFSNYRFICVRRGSRDFLSRILGIKELYLFDLRNLREIVLATIQSDGLDVVGHMDGASEVLGSLGGVGWSPGGEVGVLGVIEHQVLDT